MLQSSGLQESDTTKYLNHNNKPITTQGISVCCCLYVEIQLLLYPTSLLNSLISFNSFVFVCVCMEVL